MLSFIDFSSFGVTLNDFTNHKSWRFLQYAIIGGLLIAVSLELWDLWQMMLVAFQNTNVDFLVSGRAILNGYIPYTDHLDVKAPGTIFLGALSLLLTGDGRFEWAFKIIIVFSTPVLMMALTYRETRVLDWFKRWSLLACSFLIGSEFTLHILEKGGNNLNNAEPFGIFFALLYLIVIAWDRQRMSYLRLGLASLFMLCTIGMKEPFLFVLLAMNLLLARDRRFFVRSFLVPLMIAYPIKGPVGEYVTMS